MQHAAPVLAMHRAHQSEGFLSTADLMRAAPSIFTREPHPSRVTEKFQFIPTIDILEGLREEGFMPVAAGQSRVRDAVGNLYTKHVVRLRPLSKIPGMSGSLIAKGEVLPEISIGNAHDGSAHYEIDAGLFRLICLNGMTVSMGNLGSARIKHLGADTIHNVIEGTWSVVEDLPQIADLADRMTAVQLTPLQQLAFAQAALTVRYQGRESPIPADTILRTHRHEDDGAQLWRVFNRVQENLTKGGIRGISSNGRRVMTRSIRSVTEDIRVNRDLWSLAATMADPIIYQ